MIKNDLKKKIKKRKRASLLLDRKVPKKKINFEEKDSDESIDID